MFDKINVPCNASLLCGNWSGRRFNVSGSVLLFLGAGEVNIPLNLVLHLPNMFTRLETLRNVFACDVKSETDSCFKNDCLLYFLKIVHLPYKSIKLDDSDYWQIAFISTIKQQ